MPVSDNLNLEGDYFMELLYEDFTEDMVEHPHTSLDQILRSDDPLARLQEIGDLFEVAACSGDLIEAGDAEEVII
jgi:hypothetical protein